MQFRQLYIQDVKTSHHLLKYTMQIVKTPLRVSVSLRLVCAYHGGWFLGNIRRILSLNTTCIHIWLMNILCRSITYIYNLRQICY